VLLDIDTEADLLLARAAQGDAAARSVQPVLRG
jgi:hypothetical protein